MLIVTDVYDHRGSGCNPYQAQRSKHICLQVAGVEVSNQDSDILQLRFVGWVKHLTLVVDGRVRAYFSMSESPDWQPAGFWGRNSGSALAQTRWDRLRDGVFFLSDGRTPLYPFYRFVEDAPGGGSSVQVNLIG